MTEKYVLRFKKPTVNCRNTPHEQLVYYDASMTISAADQHEAMRDGEQQLAGFAVNWRGGTYKAKPVSLIKEVVVIDWMPARAA